MKSLFGKTWMPPLTFKVSSTRKVESKFPHSAETSGSLWRSGPSSEHYHKAEPKHTVLTRTQSPTSHKDSPEEWEPNFRVAMLPSNVMCTYTNRMIPSALKRLQLNPLLKVFDQSTKKHVLIKYASNFYTTQSQDVKTVNILGHDYETDSHTNITPKIIDKIDRKLHCQKNHPLNLISQRIENYFYKNFLNRGGNPLFSKYDRLSPVVTLEQNFDNLLVPQDHSSRALSESYYINSKYMMRAHTTAHQKDLIEAGLDAFLIFGDVYRRDTVDSSHYPIFHQLDAVRLYSKHEIFGDSSDMDNARMFNLDWRKQKECDTTKQGVHTYLVAHCLQQELQSTLEKLAFHLFGDDVVMQWVDAYFPFTHPSWELEIKYQGEWMEVLGCGIIQQEILHSAGAGGKVGWAFGLGLERLAMKLFSIPDIRIFWSQDPRFLAQFDVEDPETKITFKPFSNHPPCKNDASFWIPENFVENDFFEIVRTVGGDCVEHVEKFDEFVHPKTSKRSQAYHIVYRHTERNLTQEEVDDLHNKILAQASNQLGIEVR